MTYVVYSGRESDDGLRMVSASDDEREAMDLARSITAQRGLDGSRWQAAIRPCRDILKAPTRIGAWSGVTGVGIVAEAVSDKEEACI